MAENEYTLLAVCTGNICRSPAMERLLAHVFAGESEIRVHSGGTYAHDGWDMQSPMKERVRDYGADAEGFVAQQVTPEMVRSSDLILTATGVHVEDVLAEVPDAAGRTFTVREFERLVEGIGSDRLRVVREKPTTAQRLAALVPLVDEQRRGGARAGGEDDVVDPYMLPEDVYDDSFRQLSEPIEALAQALHV